MGVVGACDLARDKQRNIQAPATPLVEDISALYIAHAFKQRFIQEFTIGNSKFFNGTSLGKETSSLFLEVTIKVNPIHDAL